MYPFLFEEKGRFFDLFFFGKFLFAPRAVVQESLAVNYETIDPPSLLGESRLPNAPGTLIPLYFIRDGLETRIRWYFS